MVPQHMFEHNFHFILIRLDFQVYTTKDIFNARYLCHVSNLKKLDTAYLPKTSFFCDWREQDSYLSMILSELDFRDLW
jgi:hypothetical protein